MRSILRVTGLFVLFLSVSSSVWAQEAAPLAGYEDGEFFLRSADGNYYLSPSIVLQLQYQLGLKSGEIEDNGFFIRRGRVKFSGNMITKALEYEVEFDVGTPDPGDPQFDLKDLYLDYRIADFLRIKAGQYKVPFGSQELTSSKKQQFVERSLASEEFVPGRDIGLMLWGPDEGGLYEYYLGVFNGNGDNNLNIDKNLMFAGRFVWTPLGTYKENESDLVGSKENRLTMAVDAFYNQENVADDDKAEDLRDLVSLSASAGYKYSGFSLKGEYFNRIDATKGNVASQGYYAQAGYFLVPHHLELAVQASGVFKSGADASEQAYSGVLNYFIRGQNAKIQLGYTYGVNTERDHAVQLKTQLYF